MKKSTALSARKKKSILTATIISAALIAVAALLFVSTDIYVNRAYLAKKHFSQAFEARMTGNCETFYEFIAKDVEGWKGKCSAEKSLTTDPFYGFKVLNATIRGDRAFIQAELVRGAYKDTYPVTYEMKLTDGRWYINQNAN